MVGYGIKLDMQEFFYSAGVILFQLAVNIPTALLLNYFFIEKLMGLDQGAESGRGLLGTLTQGKIEISEVHRFLTGGDQIPTRYPDLESGNLSRDNSLVWDFVRFWREVKECIHQASRKTKLESVGVDAWGVDSALLDKNGQLLSFPFHYRDSRNDGMMEEAFKRLSRERIYEITGIQFMQINTLCQLLSLSVNDSPILKAADKLVMVPDLINYWLTGRVTAEFTDATTSQIMDARKGCWSEEIIQAMGFPAHIFPEIVMPGTVLGPLRASVAKELGCEVTVVAPPTHDTGSAVAAVPAENDDFIWISSGTWSIVGLNSNEPIINAKSYKANLTNEGGLAGSFRFSKNVMGLWLVQQCRRQWKKEGENLSYTELTEMAQKAPPFITLVDPDCNEFLKMGNMVEKINTYCQATGQPVPATKGEMIRAILQGLALRYRHLIEQLEQVSGKKRSTIHIVGGGTKNKLLNQFTSDALGKKVITGPIEATAIGNLIVQAIATGNIADWQEGVSVIRNSFDIETYAPGDQKPWDKAYKVFKGNIDKIKLAF